MTTSIAVLCPGQGAQAVGMGRAWAEASPVAAETFAEAESILGDTLGAPCAICFEGPPERVHQTDVSQPAIYTTSVACARALAERVGPFEIAAAAGLSLGEYTALHLAGVFSFAQGLELVALRGRLMQQASEASDGGMVALVGADPDQAQELCDAVHAEESTAVLVPANYNAPGQIVLSGAASACRRAAEVADERGLRATALKVAGAFHSALMEPAVAPMRDALAAAEFRPPRIPVWSNVTAAPHGEDLELLRERLVQQIVSPVKWAQTAQALAEGLTIDFHELAPGSVLRGLMRRTARTAKVISHDQP